MNQKENIKTCLQNFLDACVNNNQKIQNYVIEEPTIEMNIFGYMYSVELFTMFIQERNDLSIQIVNHAVVENGNEATQYATIIGLFKKGNKHLSFGGTFTNKLVFNGEWRLSIIRFELQCEDSIGKTYLSKEGMLYRQPGYGTKSFISNWKTIDDRIGHNMSALDNMGPRIIAPEYDTPWYILENNCQESAEEKVKDLLYKYCYGFDLATFPVIRDSFDDNVQLNIDGQSFTNKRDAIAFLKMLRKVTPRSFHSAIFEHINVDGNMAYAKASRIAPDLRTKKDVQENNLEQWIDGYYELKAIKENDAWKMTELSYQRSSYEE